MVNFDPDFSYLSTLTPVSVKGENGTTPKTVKRHKVHVDLCKLVEGVKNGLLQPQMAEELNVSLSTIKRKMAKNNIYEIAGKTSVCNLINKKDKKEKVVDVKVKNILKAAFNQDQKELSILLDVKTNGFSTLGRSSKAVSLRKR